MSYATSVSERRARRLPLSIERNIDGFIARTYSYFLLSLSGIIGAGVWAHFNAPSEWLKPLAISEGVLWVLCGWFGLRQPLILIFPVFSVVTGLVLGLLSHQYLEIFEVATFLTFVAFTGLTAFVWISRIDFSFLIGFLFMAFWVLLGGWILSFFFQYPLFLIGWTGFGVITFGCWILYDTSQILYRANSELTEGVAAFELILDIVGFHRWLLEHLRHLNIFGWTWGDPRD